MGHFKPSGSCSGSGKNFTENGYYWNSTRMTVSFRYSIKVSSNSVGSANQMYANSGLSVRAHHTVENQKNQIHHNIYLADKFQHSI